MIHLQSPQHSYLEMNPGREGPLTAESTIRLKEGKIIVGNIRRTVQT